MTVLQISAIVLFVSCCLNATRGENEPSEDNYNYNSKLLDLERDVLRLRANQCERSQDVDELLQLAKVPLVAFRSFLQNSIDDHRIQPQKLDFDIVELNLGHAYDPISGTFTAPVNGLYMFSMKLGDAPSNQGALFLVQAVGNERQSEYIDFTFVGDNKGWTAGSTSTVTVLKAGDVVWVELEGLAAGMSKNNRFHTSFSGALIHQL
ncbi:positive regulation of adiponectin secretion [Mactra antiquata]